MNHIEAMHALFEGKIVRDADQFVWRQKLEYSHVNQRQIAVSVWFVVKPSGIQEWSQFGRGPIADDGPFELWYDPLASPEPLVAEIGAQKWAEAMRHLSMMRDPEWAASEAGVEASRILINKLLSRVYELERKNAALATMLPSWGKMFEKLKERLEDFENVMLLSLDRTRKDFVAEADLYRFLLRVSPGFPLDPRSMKILRQALAQAEKKIDGTTRLMRLVRWRPAFLKVGNT